MSILKHHTLKFADTSENDPPEDGDFVTLGLIADESESGEPEIQTDDFAGGMQLAAGATLNATWRVLGDGTAWLSDLRDMAASNGDQVYFRVYAANGTDYTEYGPGVVVGAWNIGRSSDPRRVSTAVRASFSGDMPDDFMRNGSDAAS
jgi:hypothetical protein